MDWIGMPDLPGTENVRQGFIILKLLEKAVG